MSHLKPNDAVGILAKEYNLASQTDLAKFLGLSQGRISQIKGSGEFTKANLLKILRGTYSAGRKEGLSKVNAKILNSFGTLRGLNNQNKIAKALRKTPGAVAQWKTGYVPISEGTITTILKSAISIGIRPLFEMAEVRPTKPGGKWYIIENKDERKKLLNKLVGLRGVYCYFDSRGYLTYVGKADKTPLDREVEARLNAKISKNRILYRRNLKKHTQTLRQGEIIKFVSAYEVYPRESISRIEALMIRVTANMQYNNRLENLSK